MKNFEDMYVECYFFSQDDVIRTSNAFEGEWDNSMGGSSEGESQNDPYGQE